MTVPDPVYFLLVDDLEENLLALEALLRRDGLVPLKAHSGPEALEYLLKYDVALALVDVQMPGMDGFELAELIRGTERTRRIPLIFLTAGNADPQRRFRGYEAGAVDFIRKPIEPDVLRSKADVFFELFRQRQEVTRQRDELRAATEENARLLEVSRRHADALQTADRRKDEFLATLAHELRNPLAPIRSAVEIMHVKGFPDPELEQARQVVERQVGNMSRLLEDLLDVSRIATGKIMLRRESIALAHVVAEAVELSRPLIEAKQHELQLSLPSDPVVLHADAVRLTQVLSNLISNAAKYTDAGGRIRLQATVEGDHVEIRVADSGIGIPREMLHHVFDLFTQIESSLGYSKGGLGVGLALVRRLVELHGGTVTAESAGLGRGSTFVVRLPFAAQPTAPTRDAAQPKSPTPQRCRVLIIDDNVDAATILGMLIRALGHETHAVHSGTEAVTAAQEFGPNVIFLDIGLPGISGYDVARELRREPTLADTMIVAVTGWGSDEDKRRSEEAGFDLHLIKPIDAAAVKRVLAEARTSA